MTAEVFLVPPGSQTTETHTNNPRIRTQRDPQRPGDTQKGDSEKSPSFLHSTSVYDDYHICHAVTKVVTSSRNIRTILHVLVSCEPPYSTFKETIGTPGTPKRPQKYTKRDPKSL